MRLLTLIVALPLAALGTWWGVSGTSGSDPSGESASTFEVRRKTFRVTLQEKGELQAAQSIDIKSEVEGRSTIISLVGEGSSVKKGDLLVELASDEIEERVQTEKIQVASAAAALESATRQLDILKAQNESDIRKAKLNLQIKELELERYEKGEWVAQEEDAQLRIDEAKLVFERETTNFENAQALLDKKFITRTEFEEDEFNLYKAEVNLQKAERDLVILREFTRLKDSKQKESDVEEARKELERVIQEAENTLREKESAVKARQSEWELKAQRLAKLEEQMAKTKILAPADGLVVYGDDRRRRWGDDDQIKEGAEVFERQTILQLPDTSRMKVVLRIHEAQTDKIRLGQQAMVEVEGIGGRVFSGKISKIGVLADSQNRWLNPELKEYETEVTINEQDALLKPGVTARVEIMVAELDDVLAVPVQSVFSKGAHSFVFAGRPNDADPQEVQLGLSSAEFVEVRSGLTEGQHILLAVPETLMHKMPTVPEGDKVAEDDTPEDPPARKARGPGRGGGRRRGARQG